MTKRDVGTDIHIAGATYVSGCRSIYVSNAFLPCVVLWTGEADSIFFAHGDKLSHVVFDNDVGHVFPVLNIRSLL